MFISDECTIQGRELDVRADTAAGSVGVNSRLDGLEVGVKHRLGGRIGACHSRALLVMGVNGRGSSWGAVVLEVSYMVLRTCLLILSLTFGSQVRCATN